MNTYHIPVMLKEVIQYLNVQKGKWYIDGNLGGGGHTEAILKSGGKVLGIDLDPDSISEVAQKYHLSLQKDNGHLVAKSENLILYQDNFANFKEVTEKLNLKNIAGVLFDLGVSSYQLETAQRGFSFNVEASLDMRMDQQAQIATAADLVNGLHEKELAELFWKLGEERFSRPIAKKIVEYRQQKRIETTNELASIILLVRPRTFKDRTHPATRVFQALRIAVNDELNNLRTALPQALNILDQKGRLLVISFHSLEDRIIKNFLKDEEKNGSIKILTQKPLSPNEEEISSNPRSHSGKLRAAEKII